MAASPSSSKMVALKTADGDVFEVEPSIAKEMQTVQAFIDADPDAIPASAIPLPNVHNHQLVRIIEYCKQHRGGGSGKVKEFDAEFLKAMNNEELMDLILVANYLDMKDLFEFLTESMADRIQNKSVEYARKLFGVTNSGYTAEEEAKYREDNAWVFNGVDADDECESSSAAAGELGFQGLRVSE